MHTYIDRYINTYINTYIYTYVSEGFHTKIYFAVNHIQKKKKRKKNKKKKERKKTKEGSKHDHKSYFSWLCFIENSARRLNIKENWSRKKKR
jgi:galactokinase/mevalonate kinase-like predicted kinase